MRTISLLTRKSTGNLPTSLHQTRVKSPQIKRLIFSLPEIEQGCKRVIREESSLFPDGRRRGAGDSLSCPPLPRPTPKAHLLLAKPCQSSR